MEGNYLAVKAYQYISLTSVMLLDCFSIPSLLVLTSTFLRTRYSLYHMVGALVCVAGVILIVFSDVHSQDGQGGGQHVGLGDLLVVCAAILYACSNVGQKFYLRKVDFIELLAHVGLFGTLISFLQLWPLEWHQVANIHWTSTSILPFLGFGFSLFSIITFVPHVLQTGGSAMLNLSILTSDMWAVALRACVFHQHVDNLYFFSFAMVVIGVVLYSLYGGTPTTSPWMQQQGVVVPTMRSIMNIWNQQLQMQPSH